MPFSAAFLVDTLIALGAALLLLVAVLPKKKLTRIGGAIMLLGYAAYLLYLL